MHYIFDPKTGKKVALIQAGEVEGFRPGDRIQYSEQCYPPLRGKNAKVLGFDEVGQIWTQPDGQTRAASTRADHANKHLIKLS